MLKSKIFALLIFAGFSFQEAHAATIPCDEELIAVAAEIAILLPKLNSLLSEMKSLDKSLTHITFDLDKITKSESMTFGNTMGATLLSTQVLEDKGRVFQSAGFSANSRLNFLKSSLVRLKFKFEQDEAEAIKRFGQDAR